MKTITIIAAQISAEALTTALPADGVVSVTVTEAQTFSRTGITVESYRGRKIAQHFSAGYRIEVVVEDSAVDRVIEGVAFARSAGLLGDARAYVSAHSTTDLFAAATNGLAASA